MAKIPTDLPQVNAAPLPGVQVSPESFGAGVGRALSELGGTVVNSTTKLQNDANTAEAQDIMNKFSKATRESLYRVQGVAQDGGQADTRPGFYTLSGKNAVNASPKYQSELDKTKQSLIDGASNDKVRELIKAPMSNAADNYASGLGRYAVSQQKVAEKVIAVEALNQATQNVIASAGNIPEVQTGVNDVWNAAYSIAIKETGDANASQDIANSATTKAYVGVFNNLLQRGDTKDAMLLYEKIKGSPKFNPTVRGEVLKKIREIKISTEKKASADIVNGVDPGDAASINAALKTKNLLSPDSKKLRKMLTDAPSVQANRVAQKAVDASPGLFQGIVEGKVDREQLSSLKRDAILSGATSEQLKLYDSLDSMIIKSAGGLSKLRSDKVYADIVTEMQNLGIRNKAGKVIVDSAAPASKVIELQRKIVDAINIGQISRQEGQSFLTKVIPSVTKQVTEETGQSGLFGIGGGPADIYDIGFEAITQLLKNNGQEDNLGLKTALYRTFVFQADALKIDQIKDPVKRADQQDALARLMSAEYAKKIAPNLGGLSPDSLPNGIFVDGKLYNIFDGMSAVPTATGVFGIETRRLKDGRVVQVLKGTNTVIRYLKKGGS